MLKTFSIILAAAIVALATGAASAAVVSHVPQRGGTPSGSGSNEYDCGLDMGYLRVVRFQELRDYADGKVSVHQVCEGLNASLTDVSNIGVGLQQVIAQNAVIAAALTKAKSEADEVVGVRFGANNSLIVYVHRD